ncbi:MAG: DUF2555 domain-containing protein [Cyanobacteria bacterium J06639_1]
MANSSATLDFDIASMTAEDVAALAQRLEQDRYDSVFDCLDDWHALKAVAYQAPQLAAPYVHLLEMEVDED